MSQVDRMDSLALQRRRRGRGPYVPLEGAELPTSLWPAAGVQIRSVAAGVGLLTEEPRAREDLAAYRARGGYRRELSNDELFARVEELGLLGRGGAAFPLAVKLRGVAERPGPRYVVANGEEGEPLSIKDRWLMRIRPHLVLDGLFRAARLVDAEAVFVYLSDADAAASVHHALTELHDVPVPVEIVRIAPAYVGGEETAAVRAIDGGPALPVDKPPRPYEAGVRGRPTLISNVETLAHLATIRRDGPGTTGNFLLTLSGSSVGSGLVEVPLGSRMLDVVDRLGGLAGTPRGALMGGYFAGLIGPDVIDLRLDYQALRERGTGLGCGAIWVIGPDECPIAIATDLMEYFEANNARQCGPCMRGTASMAGVLQKLSTGAVDDGQLEKLTSWSTSLRGRGACAYLDGAANLAASVLREFPADVRAHRSGVCETCATRRHGGYDRFALSIDREEAVR